MPGAAVRGPLGRRQPALTLLQAYKGGSRAAWRGLGEEIITTVIVEGFHMSLSRLFLATTLGGRNHNDDYYILILQVRKLGLGRLND